MLTKPMILASCKSEICSIEERLGNLALVIPYHNKRLTLVMLGLEIMRDRINANSIGLCSADTHVKS